MRKNEDIVREIMEAGYGYNQPGILDTMAKAAVVPAVAAGGYLGKKAGQHVINTVKNSGTVRTLAGHKARGDILSKLKRDFKRFDAGRPRDQRGDVSTRSLIDFGHAMYGADLTPFFRQAAAPQAQPEHPAHPPIAPEAPAAAPAAPNTRGRRKAAPGAAKSAPADAPKDEPKGTPSDDHVLKRQAKKDGPPEWEPHLDLHTTMRQKSAQMDREEAQERRLRMAKQKKTESLLDMSFSEILAEGAIELDEAKENPFTTAMLPLITFLATSPERTREFMKSNRIASDTRPEAARTAPQAAPAASAPKGAAKPAQGAPGATGGAPDPTTNLTRAALNAEIAKIMPLNHDQVEALRAKVQGLEGAQTLNAFDNAQALEAAKAIAAAVLKLTK